MNYKLIDLQYDIEELRKRLITERDSNKRELIMYSISALYRKIEENFNVKVNHRNKYQFPFRCEYDAIDDVMFDLRNNKRYFLELFSNFNKINFFKSDNLNLYQEFSWNEMHEIFSMFFSNLGNNCYLMYKEIFNNSYISDQVYFSSLVDGSCTYIPALKRSYISINASRCFMIYLYTIIHEMGHYYESNLLVCNNLKDFYLIINSPISEVSSLFFTNIFLSFLLERNIYKREVLTSFTIDNENIITFIREANFCFRYMNECKNYTLGNNINFIDLEYFNQLKRSLALEEGMFYDYNRGKINILDSVKYGFSNVIADHLWNDFMNDKKLAFKRLSILINSFRLPPLEVIKKMGIKSSDIESCEGSKIKSLYVNKRFMS